MKKVTASAPGKLLLFGDHAVVYGHPCIVTAIDQRLSAIVELRGDNLFTVNAVDLKVVAYQKSIATVGQGEIPKAVQFLETILEQFLLQHPQKTGITVSTQSDFSSQFGFGSSSAVSVAFAKALYAAFGTDATKEDLFKLVYQSILKVQKVGSGFDVAAAIWGGTLYYVTPAKVVEKISITSLPLAVGYTGLKVSTAKIVQEVAVARTKDLTRIDGLFQRSTEIVEQARAALEAANWSEVGHLMNQNQTLLAELGVSSPELYRLIEAAKKAGAYGAKLSGAGKGDCMIAVVEAAQKNQVEAAINQTGGQALSVQPNAEGVRIEKE